MPVRAHAADARSFELGSTHPLAILPMQVAQLLGGRRGRRAMLDTVGAHLEPGALLAVALADPFGGAPAGEFRPPLPDVLEVDGWVLSSTPVDVRDEGDSVAIDRHRQAVSPAGELIEEVVTISLESVTARGPRRKRPRPGSPSCRPARSVPRATTSAARSCCWRPRGDLAGLRALPELMNIYADRGNIAVLRARCEWRGMGFELAGPTVGEPLDPGAHDLFYIGGGQDRDQAAVAHDMTEGKNEATARRADRGAVVLGRVRRLPAAGPQLRDGRRGAARRRPGRPAHGAREDGRLIGNCAIEADLGTGPRVIAGFENHGGRTYPGRAEPLGRVLKGHGNNGADGFEGVRRGNVIGTYLHGPLLPKNVWLADRLIELALGIELEPLDDELEEAAHVSREARGRRLSEICQSFSALSHRGVISEGHGCCAGRARDAHSLSSPMQTFLNAILR